MTKNIINAVELKKTHRTLNTIDHPKRLELLNELSIKSKMNVTQIYTKLKLKQAETSHHLKKLRDTGILVSKREGKEIYYSINPAMVKKVNDCIDILNK